MRCNRLQFRFRFASHFWCPLLKPRVDNTKESLVSNWPIVADACQRIVYKCIKERCTGANYTVGLPVVQIKHH